MSRRCVACQLSCLRGEMVRFSKDVKKRECWLRSLTEEDCDSRALIEERIRTTSQPYLCLGHFDGDQFYPSGSLKPSAAPKLKGQGIQPATHNKREVKMEIHWKDENDNDMEQDSIFTDQQSEYEPISSFGTEDTHGDMGSEIDKFQGFLVDSKALMHLLKNCPLCHRQCQVTTILDGACLKANRKCTCIGGQTIPQWSSSTALLTQAQGSKEKLQAVNLDLCTSTIASGNSFKGVERFFRTMEIPFVSESTYHRHKKVYVKKAIEEMHSEQHEQVIEMLANQIKQGTMVDLYGDGQFDSRGYSAFVVRYVVMDATFNFIVNATLMRKKRGESSAKLEPSAHKIALAAVIEELKERSGMGTPVKTFTSDRHKIISNTMKRDFSSIRHMYDAWHFFRNVTLDIIKAKKLKLFEPLVDWSRSITNHMWYSVAKADGNGALAKEMYLSVLEHIQGKHSFTESSMTDAKFTLHTSCQHGPVVANQVAFLSPSNLKHVKALRRLSGILTAGSRPEDIQAVSPVYATSEVESANALHMMYANKNLYFSEEGFSMRSKLTTIHWNNLKLDENLHQMRTVIGNKSRYCKTRNQVVQKDRKTEPSGMWRIELKWKARNVRYNMEHVPRSTAQGVESPDDITDDELDVDQLSSQRTTTPPDRIHDDVLAQQEAEDEWASDGSEEL